MHTDTGRGVGNIPNRRTLPVRFILLFFKKKLVQFLILKEVKPSPDSKMTKLLYIN